jgi:predicted amidohydrolase
MPDPLHRMKVPSPWNILSYLLTAVFGVVVADTHIPSRGSTIRVAAVQMKAELGEVDINLEKAEKLVRDAFGKKAQWVILPEFFTSAMAVHPKMLNAARPLEGKPTQRLRSLAKEFNGVVGGSFLAIRDGHIYNTFVLAYPDGSTFYHNKDYPTFLENNYYLGGYDDGLLPTPGVRTGAALCWEFVRSATAKRLLDKVDIVIGGACWWAPSDDINTEAIKTERANNLALIKETPVKFARMLGVPIVFAQHAGNYVGSWSPDDTKFYNSHFIGETMIVDGHGKILAKMSREDGEGVIVADITLGKIADKTDPIPQRFWIPDLSDINGGTKEGWEQTMVPGRKYYDSVTYPNIKRQPKVP